MNGNFIDSFQEGNSVFISKTNGDITEVNGANLSYGTLSTSSSNNIEGNIIGNADYFVIYNNDAYEVFGRDDLSIIQSISFPFSPIEGMNIVGDYLQIAGGDPYYSSFIRSEEINTPLEFEGYNISVGSLTIDSSDLNYSIEQIIPTGNPADTVFRVQGWIYYNIELSNLGTEPIDSFIIWEGADVSPWCANEYNNVFTNIPTLMPGESRFMNLRSKVQQEFTYVNNTFNYNLELWFISPNSKLDINDSNNYAERSGVIVSSKSPVLEERNLSLFPNPTSKVINLQGNWKSENTWINIYDTSGRLVFQKELNPYGNNISEEINIRDLSNGIYFLEWVRRLNPAYCG
ncbi:MAG: T9SS type A sorting domain-containing protein, partial [Saprospiraceae bacterium]